MFLNNITDYFFKDWPDKDCLVVTFNPSQNEKGKRALHIDLTDQIFNDKTPTTDFEAKIIDLKYETQTLTRTVSGIIKGMSKPIGATIGGNGTYLLGYPEVIRELNIHFRRIDDIGWGTIDVRDLVLLLTVQPKVAGTK